VEAVEVDASGLGGEVEEIGGSLAVGGGEFAVVELGVADAVDEGVGGLGLGGV